MSGLLGQMLQGVLGGNQAGQTSPIAQILQQVLSVRDGDNHGIAAIVSRFGNAGLGQQVQSWIQNGENMPVSPDQVGQAFTPQELDTWAQQAGTTTEALRGVLAVALPHVIDHATPNAEVPSRVPNISALLGQLLGGGARPE